MALPNDKVRRGERFVPVRRCRCNWTISDFDDYIKVVYRSDTRVSIFRIPVAEALFLICELSALDFELKRFKNKEVTLCEQKIG